MGQVYSVLRIGCMAGLAFIRFQEFQAHDLPHATLALGLALLAAR
jgi:hypothetical protein